MDGRLFFDQYDSQVGVIGVLAGPAGLRATGWRLAARNALTEPDETVQRTIGFKTGTGGSSGAGFLRRR